MNINLGCGRENLENFVGIDCVDFGFNKVADMEIAPLPFDDKSVDYIYAHHFFEHLHDVKNCLNECWRVLKPEGILEIIVPYGLWSGASKPVHHQLITECWFDWLRRSDNFLRYGYCPWTINQMDIRHDINEKPFEIFCRLIPAPKI